MPCELPRSCVDRFCHLTNPPRWQLCLVSLEYQTQQQLVQILHSLRLSHRNLRRTRPRDRCLCLQKRTNVPSQQQKEECVRHECCPSVWCCARRQHELNRNLDRLCVRVSNQLRQIVINHTHHIQSPLALQNVSLRFDVPIQDRLPLLHHFRSLVLQMVQELPPSLLNQEQHEVREAPLPVFVRRRDVGQSVQVFHECRQLRLRLGVDRVQVQQLTLALLHVEGEARGDVLDRDGLLLIHPQCWVRIIRVRQELPDLSVLLEVLAHLLASLHILLRPLSLLPHRHRTKKPTDLRVPAVDRFDCLSNIDAARIAHKLEQISLPVVFEHHQQMRSVDIHKFLLVLHQFFDNEKRLVVQILLEDSPVLNLRCLQLPLSSVNLKVNPDDRLKQETKTREEHVPLWIVAHEMEARLFVPVGLLLQIQRISQTDQLAVEHTRKHVVEVVQSRHQLVNRPNQLLLEDDVGAAENECFGSPIARHHPAEVLVFEMDGVVCLDSRFGRGIEKEVQQPEAFGDNLGDMLVLNGVSDEEEALRDCGPRCFVSTFPLTQSSLQQLEVLLRNRFPERTVPNPLARLLEFFKVRFEKLTDAVDYLLRGKDSRGLWALTERSRSDLRVVRHDCVVSNADGVVVSTQRG
ncbi:hypothetical protein BLNAU_17376 [Blattamonas nauphoetae]|uniref:Uncharacterized protein n=1 Tax=Blattamonas nauphoetae TaxID=2049346 RepID=A0ABQ9X7C6_9EUKA|nr:hypothetical protein BLNAU_17376 [Blattamonas nauphoetae]